MYSNIWYNYVVFWLFKMTFHNLQNSLIYRLKTQEIAFQRLCISKFPRTPLARSLGTPLSITARYGPVLMHSFSSTNLQHMAILKPRALWNFDFIYFRINFLWFSARQDRLIYCEMLKVKKHQLTIMVVCR